MESKVINLFGEPSAGKSIIAADLLSLFKRNGKSVEVAWEFAKKLTWLNQTEQLKNQFYVFGNQHNEISKLLGKVEWIITDSPLPLSIVYNKTIENIDCFDSLVIDEFNKFENYNFFIERGKNIPYENIGRSQNEEESKAIKAKILSMLGKNSIDFMFVTNGNNEKASKLIYNKIFGNEL